MNPVTLVFDLRRILFFMLAVVVWTISAFGTGYVIKGNRDQLAEAKVEAKQEATAVTVSAVAPVVDDHALTRLKAALGKSNARAATLEQTIKDQAHANPAAVDCRLPDRLRDQINADLAAVDTR